MDDNKKDSRNDRKKRKTVQNIIFVIVLVVIILVAWYLISEVFRPNAEGAGHIQNFFESIQAKLSSL